jgi:hypothetical protein
MEADGVGRIRFISFIHNRLAVDERERLQRRDGFIKTIAGKRGRQRLAKPLLRLGKQKERDRFWRQERRMDDQRLGSRVKLGSLLDRKREGFRNRQPIVRPAADRGLLRVDIEAIVKPEKHDQSAIAFCPASVIFTRNTFVLV